MSGAILNIIQEGEGKEIASIQLLHDLEATFIVGTLLTVVDIIAVLAKNIFTGFVHLTGGWGRDALNHIESSVYGSYLTEKSYSRYLLGLIPGAILVLNKMHSTYNSDTFSYTYTDAQGQKQKGTCSARAQAVLTNMATKG